MAAAVDQVDSQVPGSISKEEINAFAQAYRTPKNLLATNFVTRTDTLQAALSRPVYTQQDFVYSIQIPDEGKPVTNQRSTGRCWMFAALNVMRIPFMRENNLESFEFSQSYLFFWDKFERGNFFLEQIIDTVTSDLDDRVVQFLLSKPTEDGGQYDMIANLVYKHGLVPKDVYPESKATELSRRVNWLINFKLRDYAMNIRNLAAEMGDAIDYNQLRELKKEKLNEYFRILCIHFGEPPQVFSWQAKRKDKTVFRVYKEDSDTGDIKPISPLEFYEKYVKNFVDVENMVSVVHDPRNEPEKLYTVDRLNNMIGGLRPFVKYVNLPVEQLKQLAITCLKRGEPVWFGCHVSEFFDRERGVMSMDQFDFQLLLGADLTMNKRERLEMGESLMTHAMVFTGVDIEEKDGVEIPKKWRVENSWSDTHGQKGYCMMTDEWFSEFNYQIVIHVNDLPDEMEKLWMGGEPVHLPPWDPMGSLAK